MGAVMHDLIVGCVNDAIENEHGKFTVNQEALDKLLAFGDVVDIFATRMSIYNVAAGVRTLKKTGLVSFEVDELVLEHGASDPFFAVIQGVDSIEFSKSKDGRLLVSATVNEVLTSGSS